MIQSIAISSLLLLFLAVTSGYGNEFKHRRAHHVDHHHHDHGPITVLEQNVDTDLQEAAVEELMLQFQNRNNTLHHNIIIRSNNNSDKKHYRNFPSRTLVQEIIQEPGEYSNEAERQACRELIEQLSEEEVELAARTTYSYWVATMIYEDEIPDHVRVQVAMREARRHYLVNTDSMENALQSLQNTLAWRKEKNLDLLRVCFVEDDEIRQYPKFTAKDRAQCQRFRSLLHDDLSKQAMAVRGYDKEGRAITVKMTRTAPSLETNEEAFFLAQIYIAEKAIASTELRTRGKQEKSRAFFDCSASSSKNAVPKNIFLKSMKEMEMYYPERSYKAFIIDAPFWMRALFKVVKPFLATRTQEQLEMISGEHSKLQALQSVIDPDQAMSFILPHGKLNMEIDITRVINQPFHLQYDEV